MGAKKAIRLTGSDEILKSPDGSIEESVLEKLLKDAAEKNINKTRLILVTSHQRVNNFDPDNAGYIDVPYKIRLKRLFEMYNRKTGYTFSVDKY